MSDISQSIPIAPQPGQYDAEYRTIDLRVALQYAWRRRFFLVSMSLLGLAVGIALTFLIKPRYDASVRLMPPTVKEGALSTLFTARNPGDFTLGLVGSRTVADDVIEHQHLANYFHTDKPSRLRSMLGDMVKIGVDKEQFVAVTVRATEPETAMRIANEYPQALYRLNHAIALSEAAHRWEHVEQPLEEERDKLAAAEEDLKQAQQKTGIVAPDAQLRIGVGAIADLKQQVSAREAQLAGIETGGTNQNPQVIDLKSQISSLYATLHRLEQQTGGAGTPSAAKIPEQTLEIERKTREVKFHETLFEILSRQYENAQIEESYAPPVELVDRAVLPDQKSWPPRKLFALIGWLAGGALGLLFVCLQSYGVVANIMRFLNDNDPRDAHAHRA